HRRRGGGEVSFLLKYKNHPLISPSPRLPVRFSENATNRQTTTSTTRSTSTVGPNNHQVDVNGTLGLPSPTWAVARHAPTGVARLPQRLVRRSKTSLRE